MKIQSGRLLLLPLLTSEVTNFDDEVWYCTASRHNLAMDISWPPSSYFDISINLKGCIILEWYITIRFMISITLKPCGTTHLSV